MITRKRIIGLAVAAIAGIGVVVGVLYYGRHDARSRIDPDDKTQVAQGQSVYAAQCARCHGANLEGQPNWRDRQANGRLPAPPHDASGHTWHHPDAQLFGITKHGLAPFAPPGYQSDMPAFDGTLSDEQIAAVLAYIKSTWPPDIRERQAHINAQAEQQ
jgi:mono/diheme cytochrome c family protein